MTTEKRKCGCSKGPAAVSSIVQDTSPTAKICITTEKAPLPVGPYSQAVKMDKTIYISGCLGLLLDTGTLIEGGAPAEAKVALKNLGAVLDASGSSYNNVLKTTIFLADMEDFAAVNEIYRLFFFKDYPARSCVQVARLPLDAKFEIEAVATIVEQPGQAAPPPGGGEMLTVVGEPPTMRAEGSVKEASVKEGSAKEASVKEASVKEASVKEGSAQEASVKEGSAKEASVKEGSAKEASVKEGSAQEASVKEGSAKEASVKEGSAKEASVKEGSAQEASVKEGSAKEASVKEDQPADAPAEPAEAPAEPPPEAPADAPAEAAPEGAGEAAPAEEAPAEPKPE